MSDDGAFSDLGTIPEENHTARKYEVHGEWTTSYYAVVSSSSAPSAVEALVAGEAPAVVNRENPPDEVLLELGRLVWAAINLEGVAYLVCRSVQPRGGPYDKSNIGPRIDKALDDLLARPDDELRARADAWLAEAQSALMDRNSVLHASPGTFIRLEPGVPPQESDPYFLHLPNDKKRPSVNTPLSVDGLRPLRTRLEVAGIGWTELASDLWENRPAAT